jgi:HlyD family secretion protein
MPQQSTKTRGIVAGMVVLSLIVLCSSAWIAWYRGKPVASAVAAVSGPATSAAGDAVSAMGRFEPMEPVTRVGAPYVDGHPATVSELKVAEGDHVRAGQAIAVLAGKAQLEAQIRQAAARVALEQVKLEQAASAPRNSEAAAQNAEVARWQGALETTQAEYQRFETLRKTHDVSASDLDEKRNEMQNAQQMLDEAKARLAGLSELHAQDVRAARSELDLAQAELDRVRIDLANADVHAPADGVILKVRARAGEEVGAQGIVELARTARMDVLAEVYETDIGRVKMGQKAEVTSDLLPPGTRLQGTVREIGGEVGRAEMVANDTASFADARVVLVRIRLQDGSMAAGLIHGKASVIIRR